MPDIRSAIQIDVPPAQVYPLVSSGVGFTKWWAADMTVRPDGVVDLGFFSRSTIYGLRLGKTATPFEVEWQCLSGKEWQNTKLLFQLSAAKGQTILRFTHADWEAETEYFVSCNTTWGALMFRLKSAAEGGAPRPLFSTSGLAL